MSDSATAGRPVRIPGPDHPITIEPNPGRVIVTTGGRVVADTRHALTLREAGYAPVQYVPLEDVETELLTPSDHETYCPFKGEASYYSIPAAGDRGLDAVWEYRAPYDAVSSIRGHVAFYPDRVEIEERFDQP
jgi:uncharacterized protein (DUF427 family)